MPGFHCHLDCHFHGHCHHHCGHSCPLPPCRYLVTTLTFITIILMVTSLAASPWSPSITILPVTPFLAPLLRCPLDCWYHPPAQSWAAVGRHPFLLGATVSHRGAKRREGLGKVAQGAHRGHRRRERMHVDVTWTPPSFVITPPSLCPQEAGVCGIQRPKL